MTRENKVTIAIVTLSTQLSRYVSQLAFNISKKLKVQVFYSTHITLSSERKQKQFSLCDQNSPDLEGFVFCRFWC